MTVYIGVDLTAGTRPITYVILDARRRIVARAEGDFDAVLARVVGEEAAICAVDAPIGHNAGHLTRPDTRARLGLRRGSQRYRSYRVCEYELRRRGIGLYNTPLDADSAPKWMQLGWRFYAALWDAGFAPWPGAAQAGARCALEVHPHACFTALLGHRPLAKQSLEGRLQRQLILYRAGVDLPNPMTALHELSAHRLLQGDLSLGGELYDHDTLDAAAAAYTAWLVGHKPAQVSALGEPEEGMIVVPVPALAEKYA